MKKNERFVFIEARDRVAGGKRETQRTTDWHAEGFNKRKVTLDGVSVAIDLRGMLVKKTGPFSRVAHSVKLPRTTYLSDKRTAQEALEIESGIGLETPGCAQPREQMRRHAEATELAARKNVGMVDAFVAAQKRSPFGIDDPGDFGVRDADHRHRKHDEPPPRSAR